jgi:hypothetical protein
MVSLAVTRRSAPRVRVSGAALRVATAIVAAAIGAIAVAMVARAAPAGDRFDRSLVVAAIIGLPVAVGLYATLSPRTSRFGILLIGAGLVWSLTALGESSSRTSCSPTRGAGSPRGPTAGCSLRAPP